MQRERIEPTPRRSFTKKQRAEAFLACNGRCEVCGKKLGGDYEIDHRVSLFLGGKHEPSNWRALHPDCHTQITGGQAGVHAKVRRIIKSLTEPKAPSRLQSRGFDKSLSKKFNGTVVRKHMREEG